MAVVGRATRWVSDSGALALRAYRISHRLWVGGHQHTAMLVMAAARLLTGAEIHPRACIGRGAAMPHSWGIVIGWTVAMGEGCIIDQGVTMGLRHDGGAMPRLGDRVFVGANACIIGGVAIGDDAKIGAGAVVLQDVPAGWTAVGNPARLLPPKEQRLALKGRDPLLQTRDGR